MEKPVIWTTRAKNYKLEDHPKSEDLQKESWQCRGCAFLHEDKCPDNSEGLICDKEENKTKRWVEITGSESYNTPEVESVVKPQGVKHDSGKPMYNLLPADALEEVVKVLTVGAIRYNEPVDQENWRLVSNPQSRYFAAAQRHQWADQRGEFIDKSTETSAGTDCYHLACAITSLMFKLQLRIEEAKRKDKQ